MHPALSAYFSFPAKLPQLSDIAIHRRDQHTYDRNDFLCRHQVVTSERDLPHRSMCPINRRLGKDDVWFRVGD
jgi:hypothetical protein